MASEMHQSLHMLVLYIFTCWMLQDLCTHLSPSPRWRLLQDLCTHLSPSPKCRLLLLNVSLYYDWSYMYVELFYSSVQVVETLPSDRWRHVDGSQTMQTVHTEDCANLSSLIILYVGKDLIGWSWKNVNGPASHLLLFIECHNKTKLSLHVQTESKPPVIPFTQYSKISHLTHVTTWILQFIHNCQAKKRQIPKQLSSIQ